MTTTDMPRPVDGGSGRTVSKKRPRGGRSGGLRQAVSATTLLWIMACLYGLPVLWFVLSSFKPAGDLFSLPLTVLPHDPTLSGYSAAWDSANFSQYFVNTAIVCVITTILTVGASCCTGYALAKYDNTWLKVFFICILATTMLPSEVMLAPEFLVVRDLGLYNSLGGIILPAVLTATGCFMFRQFFLTVPDELIEAARIDGARELSIFLRIMVPVSRPIMLTLAILSFQWRWNDYIWPLLMLNDPSKFTVQIGIQSLVGAQNINWSVLLGGSVISMIPLILVFLVFQRYVMNANINAGLKD
ncbi:MULTISPECIES: carbohydrate ABC transporter permease [Streptomyces]|uniref:Carbohydrate ABC transporter permease n=1 Tax=Streptomyces osmaniensis TaxID=593134 RepID=A0ABP6WAV9_9ACTN|nr:MULTISPECIES: carbohydrate ABC transporter permease [unclassified Streptomyces]QWA25531.1 carbohydrate ABC transporter permease [Streptomyces sp. JCM17656]SED69242.1 alpha-1,4-digalacturonate transport system permease protein [Streptomyces sp. PAN_FS17]SEE80099.1 alpha-1,4-digalacturonate transport system permease protein [Streptomyces sp. KS_5]